MKKQSPTYNTLTRRQLLKLGGGGTVLGLLAAGSLSASARQPARLVSAPAREIARTAPLQQLPPLPRQDIRLVATDGFFSLPGRRSSDPEGQLFGFGFRGVLPSKQNATPEELTSKYKGFVQWPSPIVGVAKNLDLYITMTNLGFVVRPDLDDSHTIHWHGFRNPNAVFDGVPEVSIAVPAGCDFPYFYRTRQEGTYMYHCHFEDTEHVEMGMDGIAYIKALNGRTYDNDGGISAFDREFTLLLNEVDTTPHDQLAAVQEFVWSDYEPNYWIINGRAFPDTILRDQELAGSDFDLSSSKSRVQIFHANRGLL